MSTTLLFPLLAEESLDTRAQEFLALVKTDGLTHAEYLCKLRTLGIDPRLICKRIDGFINLRRQMLQGLLARVEEGVFEIHGEVSGHIAEMQDELRGTLFRNSVALVMSIEKMRIVPDTKHKKTKPYTGLLHTNNTLASEARLLASTREDMDLVEYLADGSALTVQEAFDIRREEALRRMHDYLRKPR